jgi:hypothetical protein
MVTTFPASHFRPDGEATLNCLRRIFAPATAKKLLAPHFCTRDSKNSQGVACPRHFLAVFFWWPD